MKQPLRQPRPSPGRAALVFHCDTPPHQVVQTAPAEGKAPVLIDKSFAPDNVIIRIWGAVVSLMGAQLGMTERREALNTL